MQWVLIVSSLVAAVIVALIVIAGVDGRRAGLRIVATPGAGLQCAEEIAHRWVEETDDAPSVLIATPSAVQSQRTSSANHRDRVQESVRLGVAAASADGAIATAHAWLSVDPAVFEAAAQAAHAPIDNLLELTTVAHLETWANATAGMQASLAGHVGEFLAQSHLADAGLTAHMAQLSNQMTTV